MFTYMGNTFYFGKIGGMYQIQMKAPASTMTMDINGKKINMEISGDGKITIGGQAMTLLPSTDTSGQHSAAAGWKMFTYMGNTFYFGKIGGMYQIQMKPTFSYMPYGDQPSNQQE